MRMIRLRLTTQKKESREEAIGATSEEYPWRPDETALIDAILGAANQLGAEEEVRAEPIDLTNQ